MAGLLRARRRFANAYKTPTWRNMVDLKILPERAVISVTGETATQFLQGLITNGPPPAGTIFSALLTPQGKILFDFFITKTPAGYLLDVHDSAAQALVKRLTLYRLRAKVEISIDQSNVVCVDAAHNRVIAPASQTSGTEPVEKFHSRRIADGIPEFGNDFGPDEMFLLDVNYDALMGVDYKKGCFVGQEVTSRMKRKGEARKRTLIASFDDTPPEKGTAITAGASTLGHIMSSVDHHALALIRLDRWEAAKTAATDITCNGIALQLTLPAYLETV